MSQKLIIDTDPGVDDTMAITFALRSPEFNIIGLTTVFGNADIENTSRNALKILEIASRSDIPVAQGSGIPLVMQPTELGTHVHGLDGFGNTNMPAPQGKYYPNHAAQFIVDMVKQYPGEVTLVPVGPLTNIALAVRLAPEIIPLVKEVVIMGGAATAPGNVTPVAEANIIHDPHAASIVFNAGWKLTMVGLDVTTKVIMSKEYLSEICRAGNPETDLIKQILPCYQNYFSKNYGMAGSIHTHDPSAIAFLIAQDLFETRQVPVFVETDGRCIGKTVPDFLGMWTDIPAVNVCMSVKASKVLDLFMDRMTSK